MKKPILKVDQLTKVYPPQKRKGVGLTAVNKISFELGQGEILGLLGPNGAGKSTTIQMLIGTLTPTAGKISYFGLDFDQFRSQILGNVTFASTYIRMPWRLSVMENLWIYGLLYGLDRKTFEARVKHFLHYFGVWSQKDKALNQLSAGQITRVMLAKAFIPHPKVVLLDEPTASLDPDMAHQVRGFVKQQQKDFGVSILYTSHNMEEVANVCDRVIFLKGGKIIAQDKPEKLAQSVSLSKMRLMVKDGLKRISRFAKEQGFESQITEREIVIELDESMIAGFLALLASEKIKYSQISIDQPTLEDYFLSMSQNQNKVNHESK